MTNDELKPFLNKNVSVVNTLGGGVYEGKLAGFKPGKFALSNLLIKNQEGGLTASKRDTTRWFTSANCIVTIAYSNTVMENQSQG